MSCRRTVAAAVWGLCLIGAAGPSSAQDAYKRLSIDELMNVDVSITTREPERIRDAAAAVTVITSDDIRRAGVTTLAEALRLAQGFFVGRFNNGTWTISPRGFSINTANKLLVMIDRRTVYTPLYGGVFWDAQILPIEDIDRIELVRGPVATLWGSNAVNGVINVVTRSAANSQGSAVSAWVGNEERGGVSLRYGGAVSAATTYRVYALASWRDDARLEDGSPSGDDWNGLTSGFRLDHRRQGVDATVQGAVYSAREGLRGRSDIEMGGGHLLATYRRPGLGGTFQGTAFYDRTSRNVPLQVSEARNTFDADAHFSRAFRTRYSFVAGGGYRHSADDTEGTPVVAFDPDDRATNLSNVFTTVDIALPRHLTATAGVRLEHNSYTGWETQPTLRARWNPRSIHTVWGAVSRAARIPTRFDTDLRIPGEGPPFLRGDDAFQSETAVSYEAGYRVRPSARLSLDSSAFTSRYDHVRSQELPTAAGQPVTLANGLYGTTHGVEVLANVQPVDAVRLIVSYVWLDVDLATRPSSRDVTGGIFEANDPTHQAGLRWQTDLTTRLQLDGMVRYVSALPQPSLRAYTEASLRLGWRLRGRFELSLIGQDLIHRRHAEFASPTSAQLVLFERSVHIRLSRGF